MIPYQTSNKEYTLFYEDMTRRMMDKRFSPLMVDACYQSTKQFNEQLKEPLDLSNLEFLIVEYKANVKKYKEGM